MASQRISNEGKRIQNRRGNPRIKGNATVPGAACTRRPMETNCVIYGGWILKRFTWAAIFLSFLLDQVERQSEIAYFDRWKRLCVFFFRFVLYFFPSYVLEFYVSGVKITFRDTAIVPSNFFFFHSIYIGTSRINQIGSI